MMHRVHRERKGASDAPHVDVQMFTCYIHIVCRCEFNAENAAKNIPYQLQRLFLKLQTSKKRAIETTDITKSFGWDSSEGGVEASEPILAAGVRLLGVGLGCPHLFQSVNSVLSLATSVGTSSTRLQCGMHTCCWLKWAANVAEISSVLFLHFSTRCWTVDIFLHKALYHSHVLLYITDA